MFQEFLLVSPEGERERLTKVFDAGDGNDAAEFASILGTAGISAEEIGRINQSFIFGKEKRIAGIKYSGNILLGLENLEADLSPELEMAAKEYYDVKRSVLNLYRKHKELRKKQKNLLEEAALLRKTDATAAQVKRDEAEALEPEFTVIENDLGLLATVYHEKRKDLGVTALGELRGKKRVELDPQKDQIIAQNETAFKKKHGIASDQALTDPPKDQLFEEFLERKILATAFPGDRALDEKFLKERADAQYGPGEKGAFQKFREWQSRLTPAKRLGLSMLLAGGVGAGLGAWTGLGLLGVTGFAGYRALRAAVGSSLGMGLNAAAQSLAEKKYFSVKREEVETKHLEHLAEKIHDPALDALDWLTEDAKVERVFDVMRGELDKYEKEYKKRQRIEATQRGALTILYGANGGLWGGIGLDALSGGWKLSFKELWEVWRGRNPYEVAPMPKAPDYFVGGKPPVAPAPLETTPGAPRVVPPVPAEAVPTTIKAEVTLGRRGVWGGVEEILKENAKNNPVLAEILQNKAKATYIIDAIKDKVVADPEKYLSGGKIVNIDRLPGGTKLNIAEIIKGDNLQKLISKAGGLSEEVQKRILENNEKILEWVKQNPGKPLTSPQVEEILRGKPAAPAPGAGAGAPAEAQTFEGKGFKLYGDEPSVVDKFKEATPEIPPSEPPPAPPPAPPSPAPTPALDGSGGTITAGESPVPSGRVLPGEPIAPPPAPTTEAAPVTPFGSAVEQNVVGKLFSPDQYKAVRGITVDRLLKAIPEGEWSTERAAMWKRFTPAGGGKWPDLPYSQEALVQRSSWELHRQVDLADAIYQIKPGPEIRKMTIEQFINAYGDKIKIKKSFLSF